jgi:hypothetical protein
MHRIVVNQIPRWEVGVWGGAVRCHSSSRVSAQVFWDSVRSLSRRITGIKIEVPKVGAVLKVPRTHGSNGDDDRSRAQDQYALNSLLGLYGFTVRQLTTTESSKCRK